MDFELDLSAVTLETPRLILRPWRQEDLDDFYAYAGVPGVGESAGWPHHTDRQTTQRVLDLFIEEKNVFAVQYKADGRVIGSFGIHPSWANAHPQFAALRQKEIGYVLSKAYWGRGLMTEAAQAVIRWLFEEIGLEAVTVGHFTENDRSRRVIEKCGFAFVEEGQWYAKQLNVTFTEKKYIMLAPQK